LKTALVVGRFQPFHLGHLKLIEKAGGDEDIGRIIIAIGSSQYKNTLENPFSAAERKQMIKQSLHLSLPSRIVEIPDIRDNERWVSHLEKLAGKFDLVYANAELEKKLFQKAGYEVRSTGLFQRERCAGIGIRRMIIAGEKWKHLVPEGTYRVMKKIRAEAKIKKLTSLP
jgi:nicotinamide-nucleotide adenylyltransferase